MIWSIENRCFICVTRLLHKVRLLNRNPYFRNRIRHLSFRLRPRFSQAESFMQIFAGLVLAPKNKYTAMPGEIHFIFTIGKN